ncbi:MAG: primosomal protein N' [Deltaproteobacteria bacterium]|nr:primosomal protein N' [Deltaproteobacteria bacterium]
MFVEKISSPPFFADVAVPLPISGTSVLSYRAREETSAVLTPGVRVVVPVGKRKITGIFIRWSQPESPVAPEKTKEILDILDETPVFPQNLIQLWQWATKYYLTTPGEMLAGMLPGGALREGEIIVSIRKEHPKKRQRATQKADLEEQTDVPPSSCPLLTGNEQLLWEHIQEKAPVSTKALRRQLPAFSLPRLLQRLEELHLITVRDRVRRKTAPRKENAEISRSREGEEHTVQLSSSQTEACEQILTSLQAEEFRVFLLHGVTGSGKTEVYLRVAHAALARGRRVLFLVPEIALTHQLMAQVRARFGHGVAVLHSAQTPPERWEIWRRIARGEVEVVVGARSAVFAPLENLGVIIVDEEHDSAYKQEENPRYHARDLAIVRGQMEACPVVLGSATPSLESYVHTQNRRYRLLELPERVESRPLPTVEVVDLRRRQRDANDTDRIFSAVLREALIENYEAGKQSLLFLNRRGYANYLQCRSCGETLSCGQCSVTLTFHLQGRVLRCHYCGYTQKAPDYCPHCRESELEGSGVGTEQVEEALLQLLPHVKVARLDRDSVRKKGVLGKVMESWHARATNVLIGTQMITKGHDAPGVTLVGVLLADVALNLPDFRAAERTFQLLTQVAGRAGRGEEPGRVIIQTYAPQHYSIRCATKHDFRRFAALELRYRKKLSYPPFARLVNVRFEGREEDRVRAAAERFAERFTAQSLSARQTLAILGPAPAPIERIKGRIRWQVLIKGVDRLALHESVRKMQEDLEVHGYSPQLRIVVDVDPYNML